ncbi:Hsp20/alpha crystallin family protein [Leptolinea tardivitalis]|uniref:Hsp20/alpha crystallin family protein n=1 Tax=Leptolinea tardivitalis TaxID=229920 RepID=UPI000783E02A|nr:Hsp20/alpha crystallin family protein [Leptolinea tardivitalis]GAP21666.1 heat shock protein Hsp20 [Leptolinea tardivitalis]
MTLYFTQTPHAFARPWARRWIEAEQQDQYCDIFIPVDIKAEEEAYELTATIPGVSAKDLNIQVVNETVTIQGEIKIDRDEKDTYLLNERPAGRFSRVLTLPDPLDASKAEAEVANGVLTLRIPKAEDAKPKSIKVVTK